MEIAWIIGEVSVLSSVEICNYRSFSKEQINTILTHNVSRRVSAKTPLGMDVRLLWIIILYEKQTKHAEQKQKQQDSRRQCDLPAKRIKGGVLILRLTNPRKDKSPARPGGAALMPSSSQRKNEITGVLYSARRWRELLIIEELKIMLRQCKKKLTMRLSEEDQQKCVGLYE